MIRTTWNTSRFGEVYNQILDVIETKEFNGGGKMVILLNVSDKKYVNRIIELEMFDANIKHEFEGVWLISKQ